MKLKTFLKIRGYIPSRERPRRNLALLLLVLYHTP
jgi:hypothetical protein